MYIIDNNVRNREGKSTWHDWKGQEKTDSLKGTHVHNHVDFCTQTWQKQTQYFD